MVMLYMLPLEIKTASEVGIYRIIEIDFGMNEFQDKKTIVHSGGKCLDIKGRSSGQEVFIADCDGSDSQKWEFEFYLTMNSGKP